MITPALPLKALRVNQAPPIIMETAKAIGIVLGPTISFEALMVNAWITKNAPMAMNTIAVGGIWDFEIDTNTKSVVEKHFKWHLDVKFWEILS